MSVNVYLKKQSFQIGYEDARKHDSITIPAHCKELLDLIKSNSHKIGDSIPLLEAFQRGQAEWFHEEAVKFCESL